MEKPEGSLVFMDGSHYKIGEHGYVFMHSNLHGWTRSQKTPGDLHEEIAKQETKRKTKRWDK
jgi:hypothetical protein